MTKQLLFAAILLASTTANAEVLTETQMSPEQTNFVETVAKYVEVYKTASNDMAAGASRKQRAKDLCAALGGMRVNGWTGFLTQLSSNGDGAGVMSVSIGNDITLKTWNNSISDTGDGTLLDPEGPVAQTAMTLPVGQAVEFSGSFIPSNNDCAKESSITLRGSMTAPEFIFRFTELKQLGDTYTPPKRKSLLKSLFGG